jgi:hypothetical protein
VKRINIVFGEERLASPYWIIEIVKSLPLLDGQTLGSVQKNEQVE